MDSMSARMAIALVTADRSWPLSWAQSFTPEMWELLREAVEKLPHPPTWITIHKRVSDLADMAKTTLMATLADTAVVVSVEIDRSESSIPRCLCNIFIRE